MSSYLKKQHFYAVVPAAGVGQRMQSHLPKQYLVLHGKTILEHTIGKLLEEPALDRIVVPINVHDEFWKKLKILKNDRIDIVEGGKTRCESVFNALNHLSEICHDLDWVLVHDVARPCITQEKLQLLMSTLSNDPVGGILAVPVTDTIKQVENNNTVIATVDRSQLWQAQTPQMFRYKMLIDALTHGINKGLSLTDEASAIELVGQTPKIVEGSPKNIKITHPDDLSLAAFYLQ